MAPTAITSSGPAANGKHQVAKPVRGTEGQQAALTSGDVIQLEHQYGAHNLIAPARVKRGEDPP